MRVNPLCLLLAALPLAAVPGCRREEVEHARVPKSPVAAPGGPSTTGAMPVSSPSGPPGGDVPPPPRPEGGLQWKLPKGWTEMRQGGGMRYATLKPPSSGSVEVSVVVLPGPAGGELANVNRWRGQIGLPAIDEAALAAARKPVKSPAGTVSVFDYTSEGQQKTRLVAGLLVAQGNSWFFKMVGDAETVGASRPDFVRLLETLRLE